MKKNLLSLAVFSLLLAACAGNPPAWWNPSNSYSSSGQSARPRPAQAASSGNITVSAPAQEETFIPQEEAISIPLPDESYEEMILTPLQDEETENASGEASAQSSPSETGQLPPPSVLE